MSPRSFAIPAPQAVLAAESRMWLAFGIELRDHRLARRWTVEILSRKAGVSRTVIYEIEAGVPASTEAAVRLAHALGLRLEFVLTDPRRRERPQRSADPVHSAMGECEAAHLRRLGYPVGLDEPYQHYQFAGRADVVAWDASRRALLHLENRTRFPDFQEMAGAYNAKRANLGASLAERAGVRGWLSETHVVVALWSSEVLHALRLRSESFRALCPDPPGALVGWWHGSPPAAGVSSLLIVLDPLATGRQRLFVGLEEALSVRPRHRGYAQAAGRLLSFGRQG
jgi:DNA-binding XRE family transcriptional regulator